MESLKFKKETPIGNFSVEILGVNYVSGNCGRYPQIEASINGNVSFFDFVSQKGRQGLRIAEYNTKKILGKTLGQEVILTMPPDIEKKVIAKFESIKAAEKAALQKHIADLLSGQKSIEVEWRQGDPLSGYITSDTEAETLLKKLKLAHDVSGWGTIVDSRFIDTVGQKFTYQQALDYTKPQRDKIEEQKKEVEKKIQNAFIKASETGKPVEIRRYTVDCSDPNEECSTDIIVEWAYPDGSTKTTRNHTW